MNLAPDDVVIVHCDIFSAFGSGVEPAWRALKENRHGFRPLRERFFTESLADYYGAMARELDNIPSPSEFLLDFAAKSVEFLPKDDCRLYVGSTVGEIEFLENKQKQCTSDSLLEKAKKFFNINTACIISAACAASNMAIARAAAAVKARKSCYAVVYAVDYVNEFTASGFFTLKSMTTENCSKPYDRFRSGLLLGDGAGVTVLCRAETAEKNKLPIFAKLSAWGMSCDAGHITAPNAEGEFLAAAGRKMLEKAHLSPDDIGAVIGHGTGTPYNDIMEIKALKKLFDRPIPLFSTKGSTGHTLAAAGLMQLAAAVMMLKEQIVPPQTSLETPEEGAENMVAREVRPLLKKRIISMNAGFGGLNGALLLEACEA